ncbi:MAG TPA: hypothetical protein VFM13_04445 [Gaiellaceae bacterium]|nr:hypothetical protein [Gaiellaceae bacterium]
MAGEDWRVEVELDDDAHGFSLGERLRALDLDDEARKRLGRHVVVTRDGSRLFLYTNTRDEADEAARVVRRLADADRLTAEIRTTRWHPVEEEWKDASIPLPRTEAERAAEQQRLQERERNEVEAGGDYDWKVHVRAPGRAEAEQLERTLRDQGLPVERRWRYLTVGALTEEDANELAGRIGSEAPGGTVTVEPRMDVPSPFFVLIGSWL